MQLTTIRGIFHRTYNGQPNFLTPDHVQSGKRGRLLYEISSGEGLGGAALYGVTVIELDGTRRKDLSDCFPSLAEAQAYVRADFRHITPA